MEDELRKTFVFGAGGHAKVVISVIERVSNHRIAGIIESGALPGRSFYGYRILGSEEALPLLMQEHAVTDLVIAVGDNHCRCRLHENITGIVPECGFPAVIHPSVLRARGVTIGKGTVVAGNVTMNSDAVIGDFCIVDNQVNIGHDAVIGNCASVAPNSSIGGAAAVGDFSAVGMGTTVVEKVTIGAHTVVGAGSTVVGDLPGGVVAFGTPARVIRTREEGEPYLK